MQCFQYLREDIRGLGPSPEDDVGDSSVGPLLDIALQHLYSREALEQEDPPSICTPPDVSQPELDQTVLRASVQSRRSTRGLPRQNGHASVSPESPSSGDVCQQSTPGYRGRDVLAAAGLQQEGSSSDAGECNGEDALAALRAKNRRAQRKCRERQKQKLAESEGRARDLERSLERLKMENSALEACAALLESLVGMREDGGRQQPLQQQLEPEEAARHWEQRGHTNGATRGRQPHNTAGYGGGPGGVNHWVTHEEVQELVNDLGCDGGNAMLDLWSPQEEVLRLTVYHGRPRQAGTPETIALTLEQFGSLPLAELAVLWREYVVAMAPILNEARADVAGPAGHRAVQLASEVRLVVSSLMSANPKGWSALRAVKMDPEGGVPMMAQPPQGWWRKVYRAMGLSVRQRRLAVAYRNRMLVRMGATLRARRQLQLRSRQLPLHEHLTFDPQGGIAVAQGLLVASDAAEALHANIAEEQQLQNEFLCSVRSVLEPLQSAIAIVHSYPWCPEALAIINCCAEEEGAPAAHQLLS